MVDPSISKRRNHPGLVVCIALAVFFPGTAAFTQEIFVQELNPSRVIRGQNATMRIRTTMPWVGTPIVTRPELQGPLAWWGLPRSREWTLQGEGGRTIRMVEVSAVIRVNAAGFHTIPPIRIRSGDGEIYTDVTEIIGLEPDEGDRPYPVTTRWRALPSELWRGQAVPLVLEAKNLTALALSDSTVLSTAPTGLLEEAPGLGSIVTRPYGTDILYDVPMGSWIWTVNESGTHTFPGARVSIGGLTRSTPGFSVEVRPLPEAVVESGAVGSFRLSVRMDEGPYRVGDVISVRVKVEGEGNMSVLKPPEPSLIGAELVNRGSSSSYLAGFAGYEGWREERYDFRIDEAGENRLEIPEWRWLEPGVDETIRRTSFDARVISVEGSAETTATGLAELLLGDQLFRYPAAVFHAKNSVWHFLALPGFMVFLLLFLLRRLPWRITAAAVVLPLLISGANLDATDASTASQARAAALAGDWSGAERIIGSLIAKHGEFPGLLHDRAIIEAEVGRPDQAVLLMRRAMQLRPGSATFTVTLKAIENHLGLTDQIPVPLRWSPSLVFVLWLAMVNILFLALAGLFYRRDGREMILLVTAIILTLVIGGAVLYTGRMWEKPTAVVRIDARPLRKIPGPLATNWIQLPPGSVVGLRAVEGDDCLVLTGYGLEGWLPLSSLSLLTEARDGF